MLYQRMILPDRQKTQLAYKVRCYPWDELSRAGKDLVVWRKFRYQKKLRLLDAVNEDKTLYYYQGSEFTIVWAFNNVPTEIEWDGKTDDYLIAVDLRISPAVPEGKIALLSFELPSSRLRNTPEIFPLYHHNV